MLPSELVGAAGPSIRELEIVGRDEAYRIRLHRGYRTNPSGQGDSRFALPRELWMSEDSMFVELLPTDMPLGGVRWWFKCRRCGRRCGVLYREPNTNARAFACRICTPFRYESQLLGRAELMLGRITRGLTRLDLGPGKRVARPKGMHHRTFDRIKAEVQPALRLWSRNDPELRHLSSSLTEIEAAVEREIGRPLPRRSVRAVLRWRA